ncbi:hypothetical protein [Phocaeicola sp.]
MSFNEITAKEIDIEDSAQNEAVDLILHFGIFFDSVGENVMPSSIASCYAPNVYSDNELYYSIKLIVDYKNNKSNIEEAKKDLDDAIKGALQECLNSIKNILNGYTGREANSTLLFDVFGIDFGWTAGVVFCNIVEKDYVDGVSNVFEQAITDFEKENILNDWVMRGAKIKINSISLFKFLPPDDEVLDLEPTDTKAESNDLPQTTLKDSQKETSANIQHKTSHTNIDLVEKSKTYTNHQAEKENNFSIEPSIEESAKPKSEIFTDYEIKYHDENRTQATISTQIQYTEERINNERPQLFFIEDKRNILEKLADEKRARDYFTLMKVRDVIDGIIDGGDAIAFSALLLSPETYGISGVAGTVLEVGLISLNGINAGISFYLADKSAHPKDISDNNKKGQQYLKGTVPWGKVAGKIFSSGSSLKIRSSNQKLEFNQKEYQALVKDKKDLTSKKGKGKNEVKKKFRSPMNKKRKEIDSIKDEIFIEEKKRDEIFNTTNFSVDYFMGLWKYGTSDLKP